MNIPNLQTLLARTRTYKMTAEESRAQRISFAYGNTAIENSAITRQMVDEAANSLPTPLNAHKPLAF